MLADFDGIKETVRTSLFQACFKATDTVRNAIAKIHDGVSYLFITFFRCLLITLLSRQVGVR